MSELKLTYFDFDGGRAEPIRLALSIGNMPFEDIRFPISEFVERAARTPLHQFPILEIDDEVITQTNGILRYVGKITGLYPEDAREALYCDEAMDMIEDILAKIVVTFRMEDEEEKRRAREALAEGPISLSLARLESMLKQRGGKYFADDRLTIADLKVVAWTYNLKSGQLDYVPTDIVERIAPELAAHLKRISAEPGVVSYYEKRKASA